MDMKRTLGKFTTPAGKLTFPLYLNEPDSKFDDSEDKVKFKAGIRLDGDGATKLRGLVEKTWQDWLDTVKVGIGKKPKVQAKNVQWYTSDTSRWDDMGESTGKLLDELQPDELIIKTSCRAFRDGEARRPAIFDAGGQMIKAEALPPIGFGTTGKLSGSMYGWTTKAGVASMSFILHAVQILELVEPGQSRQGAEDFGFSATDGFKTEADEFIEKIPGDDRGGDF